MIKFFVLCNWITAVLHWRKETELTLLFRGYMLIKCTNIFLYSHYKQYCLPGFTHFEKSMNWFRVYLQIFGCWISRLKKILLY
jgi:hypothetical protein